MRHALGVVVALLGVAVVAMTAPWTPEAGMEALAGVMGCTAVVVAATGLGGALLKDGDAVDALALGLGVMGLVLLPVAGLGLLSPWTCAGVLILSAAGWLRRPAVRWPEVHASSALLMAPALLVGLMVAFTPPWDTDEVYQHLALPSKFLLEGGLVGGLLHPDASRPMGLHLAFTAALALGGFSAAKLLSWVLAAALLTRLASLQSRAAGLAAVAVLVGSYTFVRELGLVYNNTPAALYGLLAFCAARQQRTWAMAAFAGFGLAAKYTLAPLVVGIYLLYWSRVGWRNLKPVALATVLALGLVAPWWLRNALEGLHPLFPYAGWPDGQDFHFVFMERYGTGREVADFLALPWNATVHGDPYSYMFLGRITPVALVLAPAALWAWVRGERWIAVAALGFLGWAIGPHWLRYLLLPSAVLALAAGEGFARLPRWGQVIAVGVWVLGLPSNWGPWLEKQAPSVALGEEREAFLDQKLPGYSSAAWINEHTSEDAVVALLFAWPGVHLERRWVLSSVEDHVPSRHWIVTHGEAALQDLRAEGVTHVLAGRTGFLHKVYPFLKEADFRAQFQDPERALKELLLAEGTQMFEDGRYGVWRLD